jgi:hypothetical protein
MQGFSDIKPNFFLHDTYHNYFQPIFCSIIERKDLDELFMPLLNIKFQSKLILNY